MTMKITDQVVCVLCGGVNPGDRWLGMPRHAQCSPPSEVSNTYKAYSMLAGLSNGAIRDICRQVGVKFTYRYVNANGAKSRLFHDKSHLIHQIVKVKGSATPEPTPTPEPSDDDQPEPTPTPEPSDDDQPEPTPEPTPDVEPTPTPEPTPVITYDTAEVNDWITWVQKFREAGTRRGLKVVIGPRQSQRGAIMLAHGIDLGNVAMLEIGNRMSPQDWGNLCQEASIRPPAPIKGKHTHLRHHSTDLLLKLVRARIHVWLRGPAASGKSTVSEIVANTLGLNFYATGAIATEYKLSGFVDAQGRSVITQFRKAFCEGGVFLFDEIDRSQPNAVLPFNGWLANLKADMPGVDQLVNAHPDFVALVGANTGGAGATSEYSGAFKQDAAFCDRFAMLLWDYDQELEREIALAAFRKVSAQIKGVR